jgi:3-oxoadipate enol-lactonase
MLHYRIEGSGRHILLLHPVGLDLTCFDRLVGELRPGYRVLRVDLRGHGSSPPVEHAPSLENYAQDVEALLEHLNYGPAEVIGFSFGGMIAQVLALDHPSCVNSLIVGACPSTFPQELRPTLVERGALAERGGMAAVVDATLARWFSDDFLARGEAETVRRRLLSGDVRGWSAAWRAIAALDTEPRLRSIEVPTLCLAAELDKASPPAGVEAIATAVPGARFELIAAAPHMLFIEQPRAVANAITRFLA